MMVTGYLEIEALIKYLLSHLFSFFFCIFCISASHFVFTPAIAQFTPKLIGCFMDY